MLGTDPPDDKLHRFPGRMKWLQPTVGKGFDIRRPWQLSVGGERHVMSPGTGFW
jgi:hypothetical protein